MQVSRKMARRSCLGGLVQGTESHSISIRQLQRLALQSGAGGEGAVPNHKPRVLLPASRYNALSVLVSKAGNDCLPHMQALTQELCSGNGCSVKGYVVGSGHSRSYSKMQVHMSA